MAELHRKRYNGVDNVTLGAALSDVATSVTFAAALQSMGANIATLGADEYLPLVIDNEIVYLTAYTAGATTGTISRGKEGTTGAAHSSGAAVVHGLTVSDLASELLVAVSATGTGAAGTFEAVNASGGAITRTTPAHAAGATYTVKKTDTSLNVVTVSAASGTIDGETSYKLYGRGASVTLISDGTNWLVSREVSSAWANYTPALTATTDPTLGSGGAFTQTGRWRQLGRRIEFMFMLRFGTTGVSAGSGGYAVSLPFAVAAAISGLAGGSWSFGIGTGRIFDDSASVGQNINLNATTAGGSTVTLQHHSASQVNSTTPWTWAASDLIQGVGTYEPA